MIHVQLAALRITRSQSLLNGKRFSLIVFGVVANRSAFGAGAVISKDFDHQRFVALSGLIDFLEQPANFVVGLLSESRIYLGLMCQQLFLIWWKRLPRRQACRARRQLRICRDHAELLLAFKGRSPHLVPPSIELTLVLRDPCLWDLVRHVCRTGSVVEEERFLGRDRFQLMQPPDSLIRHIRGERVALFWCMWRL